MGALVRRLLSVHDVLLRAAYREDISFLDDRADDDGDTGRVVRLLDQIDRGAAGLRAVHAVLSCRLRHHPGRRGRPRPGRESVPRWRATTPPQADVDVLCLTYLVPVLYFRMCIA